MSYLLNARTLVVAVAVLDRSWRTERRDGFLSYHEPGRPAIIALITTKNVLTNNLEQYTTLINPAIAVHSVPSHTKRVPHNSPVAAVHARSTCIKVRQGSHQMPVVSVVGTRTNPGYH